MAEAVDGRELAALQGVRMIGRLEPLLERLRPAGCERDRAGNRQLFFDQVCSLILLTFFNPSVKTLGQLREASRLRQVRKRLGCSEASLSSLSEALRVFDPELLVEIIQELLGQIPDSPSYDPRLKQLKHVPTAVDGTLLKQLPQITQASFAFRKDQGFKLHTHFEVLRGVPVLAQVTDASGRGAAGEKPMLRAALSPDRTYITDRGYEEFALFNAIVAAGSSYVCRVRDDRHFRVDTTHSPQERSSEAIVAGVVEDAFGRMGSPNSKRSEPVDHLQRRVVVRVTEHPKRGRSITPQDKEIVLATNLLDAPAEVIVLLYRFRWLIELFFRWLKCVLSCRHLLSESQGGVQIQIYCALIACLLVQLAGGDVKPNSWTYRLLCLYLQGWAEEDEVLAHFRERAEAEQKKANAKKPAR